MQTIISLIIAATLLIISTSALALEVMVVDFFWPTIFLSITTIWLSVQLLQEVWEHRRKIESQTFPNSTLMCTNRHITSGTHDYKISYNEFENSKHSVNGVKFLSELEKGEVIQEHLDAAVLVSDKN